jgi:hypothetical protein
MAGILAGSALVFKGCGAGRLTALQRQLLHSAGDIVKRLNVEPYSVHLLVYSKR